MIPGRARPDTGGDDNGSSAAKRAVRDLPEDIMKKGFSILAAVLLTAGLCSCGPDPSEASATHANQVHAVRGQPLCLAQFECPV